MDTDTLLPNVISVVPVDSPLREQQFVQFPYDLFAEDKRWIPPFFSGEFRALSGEHNPSAAHSQIGRWLALKGEKVCGRIQVQINQRESDKIGEIHARFNRLDLIDDEEIARQLLEQAEAWARERGAIQMKGPHGFTNLDESGMLVDGFEADTTFATLYNPPYYPRLLEKYGYSKRMDWLERRFDLPASLPPKIERAATLINRRYGLQTLPLKRRRDLLRLAPDVMELFLESYQELEGFVPLSEGEVEQYIQRYISFLRPDFVRVVVNRNGELVGFGLTTPDLGDAFRKAKGKLWPWGWYHLLRGMRKNPTATLILIGVAPKWRNKGVHGLIFREVYEAFRRNGIHHIRVHPMLEDNRAVHALFQDYGAQVFRRRRIYYKELA